MDEETPYPFRTRPYLRTKVWGGRKLVDIYDKPAEGDDPIGEAWEVSDLPEGQSYADNGPRRGASLSELFEDWGQALTGTRAEGNQFPLLVKILDAADDLSVQVHPSQEDIDREFPDAHSKDECWVILEAEEDGSILHGVRDGVDAEELARAIDESRADECLRRVNVEPGHVVRVVPGTIHAICSGVVLLEIQQPSDTTFRVYDYNRPGLDGQPRELHVEEAQKVANFGEQPPTRTRGEALEWPHGQGKADVDLDLLIDVPAYRIERLRSKDTVAWSVDPGSVQVFSLLEGSVRLGWQDGELELEAGQTAVIPATTGEVRVSPDRYAGFDAVVSGVGGGRLVRPAD